MPILVGGTSYYIESIIYDNSLVSRADVAVVCGGDEQPESADAEDADDHLSVNAFREYAAFRHANDPPVADTVDGVCRMYADALAEAVRFARTMPAVGQLSPGLYRNTFVADDDDDCEQWPSSAAECETAALYAHGVRVLDAAAAAAGALPDTDADDVGRYRVLAADVTAGLRRRYTHADVRSRLDALLADADEWRTAALEKALRRSCAELEYRTQRLALALLTNRERTVTELMSPHALKTHAAYYDPAAAIELHPHNTRKVFRYVRI